MLSKSVSCYFKTEKKIFVFCGFPKAFHIVKRLCISFAFFNRKVHIKRVAFSFYKHYLLTLYQFWTQASTFGKQGTFLEHRDSRRECGWVASRSMLPFICLLPPFLNKWVQSSGPRTLMFPLFICIYSPVASKELNPVFGKMQYMHLCFLYSLPSYYNRLILQLHTRHWVKVVDILYYIYDTCPILLFSMFQTKKIKLTKKSKQGSGRYNLQLAIFCYLQYDCMSKKWPILYSNLLYKMGHYFLDIYYLT